MANYLGDFAAGATVRGDFNTRAKATGAPITLASTPSLCVYKDGSVSESTAGVALTVDFDSTTGSHLFAIDTSADAFYATGSDYRIKIAAGTVDGESVVGVTVASFSIENRSTAVIKTEVRKIPRSATGMNGGANFARNKVSETASELVENHT